MSLSDGTEYISTREPSQFVSRLTGRAIYLNDSKQFVVPPTFEVVRLQSARLEWKRHIDGLMAHRSTTVTARTASALAAGVGYHEENARLIEECFKATTKEEFALNVGGVIQRLHAIERIAKDSPASEAGKGRTDRRSGESKRVLEALILLWKNGQLLSPAAELWNEHLIPNLSITQIPKEALGTIWQYSPEMEGAHSLGQSRAMMLLPLSIGGLIEIGDLDEQVITAVKPFAPSPANYRVYALCDLLLLTQKRCYASNASILPLLPNSYRVIFTQRARPRQVDPQILWGPQGEKNSESSTMNSYQMAVCEPLVFVSRVTGRTIYLNATREFAVSPLFEPARLLSACVEWNQHIDGLRKSSRNKRKSVSFLPTSLGYFKGNADLIDQCFKATTREEFALKLDGVIHRLRTIEQTAANSPTIGSRKLGRRSGEAKRILEALLLLWRNGNLLFPAGELWEGSLIQSQALTEISDELFGSIRQYFAEMERAVHWAGQRRPIKLLPTTIGGLKEIGDIDEQIIAAIKPFAPSPANNVVYGLCDQLLLAQRRFYAEDPSSTGLLSQSYRTIFLREAERADARFLWAPQQGGERLVAWTQQVSEYVLSLPNRIGLKYEINPFNALLDYVIANESIPDRPLLYCRRDFDPSPTFVEFLDIARNLNPTGVSSHLRIVQRFFDSILQGEARDEEGVVSREYINPILPEDIPSQSGNRGKTSRWPIPIRFMRMLREIIEGPYENGKPTFAWPKTLTADYFDWLNLKTGKTESIWSPARACFFLLRFLLPIRTLQCRLLSTDEADPETYSRHSGWSQNTTILAPQKGDKKRATGLIRRIWDADIGRWFNGLYITTNKTDDRKDLFNNPGQEIPWENPEILELFCFIRDWQLKFNPCIRPLSRAELMSDSHFRVSSDLAGRLDKLCFLFRDASSLDFPQEPPTDGRLKLFWVALIAELENRLAKMNETNLDGSPIRLIAGWRQERNGKLKPSSAIFDMHTLRVTGLTALIDAGVPIAIVSEFVAGHATVLMTWYYYKPWAAKVTRALNDGMQNRVTLEEEDWEDFLSNQPTELIHDLSVWNSEDGRLGIEASQSALRAKMDDGECPNGGTLCQIGGPLLNSARKVYGPVPGGSRNCVLCRFFVTGPRFLGGLSAKCNANAGKLREMSLRLKDAEARRREAAAAAMGSGETRILSRMKRGAADETVESIGKELEALSITWTAQLRLIRKIKNVMTEYRSKVSNGKLPMLLNGDESDFGLALKHCSEFEMWDRICRSSEFYTSVDSRLPAIQRARLFDVFLSRAGRPAVFATLNDQELLEVGNAWSAYLRNLVGEDALGEAIEGSVTLEELGIEADLDVLVATFQSDPRTILEAPKGAIKKREEDDTSIDGWPRRA